LDDWTTPWLSLLPADAHLELRGVPADVAAGLSDRISGSGDALVGWRLTRSDLATVEPYRALVLFEPNRISLRWLRGQGFAHVRQLSVIPSLRNPRWLLPRDASRAAARGWDLYNPQSDRGRLAKTAARAVTRALGAGPLGRALLIAHRACPPLDEILARALGTADYRLSLAPRWPGSRRRLASWLATPEGRELLFVKHRISMQAATPAGEALAYIKFATRPGAIEAIAHEARITAHVAGLGLTTGAVPRLLHYGAGNGGYLSISEPLALGSIPSEPVLGRVHHDLLRELARQTAAERTGSLLTRLTQRLGGFSAGFDEPWRDLFARGIEAVRSVPSVVELPASLAHGDFVPWNLRLDPTNGRLAVFDWEQAQLAQFPLYDCFHFQIQANTLLRHLDAPTNVTRTLRTTLDSPLPAVFGLVPAQVAALLVAYLLEANLRWFEDHRTLPDLLTLATSPYQAQRRSMLESAIGEAASCRS
jgi:hypothetical protein